jgi:hypothetical protein
VEDYLSSLLAWVGGFLLLAIFILFLPFVISIIRSHRYKWVILVLCIFGVFGLPWIVAFVWSVWPSQFSLADPFLGNPTGTGTRNTGDTLGAVDVGKSRGRVAEQLTWKGEDADRDLASISRKWVLYGFNQSGQPIRFVFDSAKRKGEKIMIGRSSMDCEFLIDDPSVSRRHAEISIEQEGIFIRDLNSSNGTRVNGQRILAVPTAMPLRGTVSVGAVTLEFSGS